jgi:hypothetical protein
MLEPVRLDNRGSPGTNTLAYFPGADGMKEKSFIILSSGHHALKEINKYFYAITTEI